MTQIGHILAVLIAIGIISEHHSDQRYQRSVFCHSEKNGLVVQLDTRPYRTARSGGERKFPKLLI